MESSFFPQSSVQSPTCSYQALWGMKVAKNMKKHGISHLMFSKDSKKNSNFLSTYWQVISLVKILTENPIWDKVNQKILFLSSYIEIPGSNLTCCFPFPEIFICEQNICENDLTKSQILPAPGNSKINRWPFNPLFTGGGGIYLPYFEIVYHTSGRKILGPKPHCKFIFMYWLCFRTLFLSFWYNSQSVGALLESRVEKFLVIKKLIFLVSGA